jgi:site-specific recombinase XerD
MSKRAVKFNWVLEPSKFLSKDEANKLSETAKDWAEAAIAKGQKTPVRDYLITDLALSTGLRVMEIAQLDCGDIFIRDGVYSLLVRNGKCGKRRLVRFGESLKEHLNKYMVWKHDVGEPTGPSDPLLLSSNTGRHLTTRAIEKAFKRTAMPTAKEHSCYKIKCANRYDCFVFFGHPYDYPVFFADEVSKM